MLAHSLQFADLVNPNALNCFLLILLAIPDDFSIGEVVIAASKDCEQTGFALALGTFKHQHIIELAPGASNSPHPSDQGFTTKGSIEFGVLSATISYQPLVEARNTIPRCGRSTQCREVAHSRFPFGSSSAILGDLPNNFVRYSGLHLKEDVSGYTHLVDCKSLRG